MPFDLVAFVETQTATNLSNVAAITDQIYQTTGDDLIINPEAPLLGGILHIGVSTPKKARVYQPGLKPAYDFYKAALSTVVDHRAGWTDFRSRPLPLSPNEKINALVQNASAEYSAVILWLQSAPITQAMLDAVLPTHRITGYADQTLTANVWNTVTPTWDADLPKGRYAVVGMKAASYLADCQPLATRLVLTEAPDWRPGVITGEMTADKTLVVNNNHDFDTRFPKMANIEFDNVSMPKFEMLSLTADTDHVFELELVKVK